MNINDILNKVFTTFKNCEPYGIEKSGPFENHKDCQNNKCPFYISENDSGCYPSCQLPHFVEKTIELKIKSHQK